MKIEDAVLVAANQIKSHSFLMIRAAAEYLSFVRALLSFPCASERPFSSCGWLVSFALHVGREEISSSA